MNAGEQALRAVLVHPHSEIPSEFLADCPFCSAQHEHEELLTRLEAANQTIVLLQHARRQDAHRTFDDVASTIAYHGKDWNELLNLLRAHTGLPNALNMK